ncbi:hypothetical protein Pyn_33419 [Prunus yedoensis var. nudiflora]|uniref:Uncharacterized protein n=1 Tax=Prunus yedoensis var. nudiflora TaxID=2094558 RepID=A0A314YDG5_PRUYE|nr:hypothetical protein Pyn_33419 [Prunus yedoensis var. nudiflora]
MDERKWLRRMLCHPNLLHPLEYVMDENSLLVIHLSFERRTLRNMLTTNRSNLSWDNRITISVEVARGLVVLYGESPPVGLFGASRTRISTSMSILLSSILKKKLYKFMDLVIRGQYASAIGFEMTKMILQWLANNPEERPTANQVWKQSQDIKNIRNL